jgi:hypothetical protein
MICRRCNIQIISTSNTWNLSVCISRDLTVRSRLRTFGGRVEAGALWVCPSNRCVVYQQSRLPYWNTVEYCINYSLSPNLTNSVWITVTVFVLGNLCNPRVTGQYKLGCFANLNRLMGGWFWNWKVLIQGHMWVLVSFAILQCVYHVTWAVSSHGTQALYEFI